ncbi:MAG: lysophospholipid acyltransferase family protein [Candidatus Contendobacter sp.]|jgi:KDO2-lipid IV(A) lauroyltransferase|nr:lysophospholipid acyltransferase family protein [Gammaproteobacteria bacterium]MCC8993745.1 lysophospholipid acyltransferase family protein [Candidatus Contendobacter sp.]
MIRQRLLTGLLRLIAGLSLPRIHGLGAFLGGLLWRMPNAARHIADRNLTLCFPELPPIERDRLLRRNLIETSKGFLELGPLWLWPSEQVLGLVQGPVAGEGELAAAVDRRRGAILLTPHLGAWEMAGLYYSSRYPLTILYRPSRVGMDQLSQQGRGRLGGRVVATDTAGIRALLAGLRRGEVLGILPDQDPGEEGGGVFAPWFGIAASTMTLVPRLALKTGAPVFLTWAERLPQGQGYSLHLQALPDVTAAASLEDSAAALNRGVEAAIRSLPTQYLWAYKRFKTRPLGQPKLY